MVIEVTLLSLAWSANAVETLNIDGSKAAMPGTTQSLPPNRSSSFLAPSGPALDVFGIPFG